MFMVLLIGALAFSGGFGNKAPVAPKQQTTAQTQQSVKPEPIKPEPVIKQELPEGIYTFESREQVEEYFKYVSEKNGYYLYGSEEYVDDMVVGEIKNESATESATNAFADAPTSSANGV